MKHLLLIGAGPGNGYSIAKLFGSKGFHISMIARNKEKIISMKDNLRNHKIESSFITADIGNKTELENAIHTLIKHHGGVDVMVYNASSFVSGSPLNFNYDQLIKDFKINVGGAFIAANEVVPYMKEKKDGKIFLTGGGSALNPFVEGFSLSLGKAAMRSYAYTLAEECKPFNIHVATITIHGAIKRGTDIDPDLIAKEFWRLYEQPINEWQTEIIFG